MALLALLVGACVSEPDPPPPPGLTVGIGEPVDGEYSPLSDGDALELRINVQAIIFLRFKNVVAGTDDDYVPMRIELDIEGGQSPDLDIFLMIMDHDGPGRTTWFINMPLSGVAADYHDRPCTVRVTVSDEEGLTGSAEVNIVLRDDDPLCISGDGDICVPMDSGVAADAGSDSG